ncbi:LPS export ABC transporter periplasmic protein LptC [Coleofasciculus sp. FACHB-1120]|uniref:LPS export ABC transporter periplasmic protein LptC n=1 Tax=Coleofasciculus sp. FACHB-1120 TaxID=2692783 RepID=UPI001689DF9F|nr:LPS export ABC transporter periplasmic protein LptC [Coleofasciculus sp. FACHB-1120]MBD2740860.1 LPS export ABC transporter periplasmic protein LptC [Coleofasciculus sp. FACHB-1120]
MKKVASRKKLFLLPIYFLLFTFLVSACNTEKRAEKKIQKDTASVTDFEGSLVFQNVTLDQADEQGRPLWKVKAEQAVYTKDKKAARIQKPSGDLFQDGKLVMQITADSGEVQEDGKKIFLKGQIVATDPRNGAVLKGNELEWRPKEDLLIVRQNLVGTHQKMVATANEGRYFSRSQQMELLGQIVATSKDPAVQIRTEHLVWQIPQQMVVGDRRIQIDRYTGNRVTEQAAGDSGQVNLKTKIATLTKNVQMTSLEPPVQIAGNSVTWNLTTQMVTSDQPVKVVHQQQQVTLTGNRGQVDLKGKVARLIGGVQGVGSRNKSQLYANQVIWNIPTEEFDAQGNVIYHQQVDPPLHLTGSRAVGKFQGQTVVVTGGGGASGSSGRVVTEIIP